MLKLEPRPEASRFWSIASPLLALLKEREPRYRALRERLARTATTTVAAPADADAGADLIFTEALT